MNEPMEEPQNRQVYYLNYLHDWADVEDLVPEDPVTPKDLQFDLVTAKAVKDMNDLWIHTSRKNSQDVPEFAEDSRSVDASPEELATWLREGRKYESAQERYREAVQAAGVAYRAAIEVAQVELRLAAQAYAPTDEQVQARSTELAATLHSHRQAAEQWQEAQEEKRQAALDAEHGTRQILVYAPKHVDSHNRQDRIAKVHLSSCNRRPRGNPLNDAQRAHDAWGMMTNPDSFSSSGWKPERTEFKFCSSCRPWKVFQEHLADFPSPAGTAYGEPPKLGPVLLTEIPENWHD